MARGRFISFEGGEGAGKSTQTRTLAAWLRVSGKTVVETREPGGSPAAERLREALLDLPEDAGPWDSRSECLLLYAARRQHATDVIIPALARGDWVISDRFSDSTMAYQGYAGAVGRDAVTRLDAWALDGLKPDLTIILDIAPEAGLKRARDRAADAGISAVDVFERRPESFHWAVLEAFRAIAAAEPDRCVIIDSTAPKVDVAHTIQGAVSARLGVL